MNQIEREFFNRFSFLNLFLISLVRNGVYLIKLTTYPQNQKVPCGTFFKNVDKR